MRESQGFLLLWVFLALPAMAANPAAERRIAFIYQAKDQTVEIADRQNLRFFGFAEIPENPFRTVKFPIASLTKPLTALLLHEFSERTGIDLRRERIFDVTLLDYILHGSGIHPDAEEPWKPVRGRGGELLAPFDSSWTLDQGILDAPSLFEPGSMYAYSNLNLTIISQYLMEQEGKSIGELITDRFPSANAQAVLAKGLENGRSVSPVEWDERNPAYGAWGAEMTPETYVRFVSEMPKIFLQTVQRDLFGQDGRIEVSDLGWTKKDGVFFHMGRGRGITTFVAFGPQRERVVFIARAGHEAEEHFFLESDEFASLVDAEAKRASSAEVLASDADQPNPREHD